MRFADTHCHLFLDPFKDDLDAVIERAQEQSIQRILVAGIDLETSQLAVELSEKHPPVYAAIGVHPNSGNSWNASTLKGLEILSIHPKVVAIGEIGLDYYRDRTSQELQNKIFNYQLDLAAECKKPVIIHSRSAIHDVLPVLRSWHSQLAAEKDFLSFSPGVLHSYEGDTITAEKLINSNFLLGISGPVTYKSAKDKQKMVSEISLQHILIETDAPYLSPNPFRGKRNEPAYVILIAQKIAELHSTTLLEVAGTTSQNADRLFAWGAFS
jgi:TatD DNase family protein